MAHPHSLPSSAHTLVRSCPSRDSVCLQQLLSFLATAGLFSGVGHAFEFIKQQASQGLQGH